MSEIVVVDGGATACRLAAFTSTGEELARVVIDAPASLTIGAAVAWQHINQGLAGLGRQLNRSADWQPELLVMGLAGSLQFQRRKEFLALIPRGQRYHLVTDGYAQLMGASNGKPGICLAVGTGSVLHWLDEHGETGMVGGWGFPVADEGSGAWLGLRALQCLVWSMDGQAHDSTLLEALEQMIGTDVSAIQSWTTETSATRLASLAPCVFQHADAGDALACQLIEEAAVYCAKLIDLAPDHLSVYLVGSIGQRLRPIMTRQLSNRLVKPSNDVMKGLWLISRISL